MSGPDKPFWDWPGWKLLGFALLLGVAQTLWWLLIYGGANWITEQHTYRVRIHFDAELEIPFMPSMVLVYMSIYLLFWMAPFILRTYREMLALNLSQATATLTAGVFFLLLPADNLFPPTSEIGDWTELVNFARRVALAHNMLPSLHVGLSVICIMVFARRAGVVGKVLLWSWATVIGISTLLLHQHYVVDVISGFALAWMCVRWVYDRASFRCDGGTNGLI